MMRWGGCGTYTRSNETTTYTYTAVGSRATVTLPNGVVTAYQYDELNRLTNLVNKANNYTILSQFDYRLDATGRRTNATEIVKTEKTVLPYLTNTLNWAYDGMYRLTNEVCVSSVAGASYTNQFQYDKAGNRWSQVKIAASSTTTITNQYNANDQLLKEVTKVGSTLTATNNYVYDANGSLTAKTNISTSSSTTLYGYDLKNKLSNVTAVGSGVTNFFVYNEQGIRVRTSSSSGSDTLYLVDGNNHTGYAQVLEETTGSTLTMSYVLGDDVLAQAIPGSTASYLLYDGHGSTRQLTENFAGNASVSSRYNYDAYGVKLSTSSNIAQTSLLYCGEQYDANLQMYNLRARFYNPSNGRFNAQDTFQGSNSDPQSLHKYAYCHSDPVNGMDPTGRFNLIELMFGVTTGVALAAYYAAAVVGRIKSFRNKLFPIPFIKADAVSEFHKQLARLCKDVYNDRTQETDGWVPVPPSAVGIDDARFHLGQGFFSQLYKKGNAYVLAFRGTQELPDWYSNVIQGGFGLSLSSQYDQAIALAGEVKQAIRGAELTMTGHSLGGGLASAAALEANCPAVTYNAAGLSTLTEIALLESSYTSTTVGYSVEGEILTTLQSRTVAPTAYGQLYRLKPKDAWADPLTLHKMKSVLSALEIE